jgi:hypothetical protein
MSVGFFLILHFWFHRAKKILHEEGGRVFFLVFVLGGFFGFWICFGVGSKVGDH